MQTRPFTPLNAHDCACATSVTTSASVHLFTSIQTHPLFTYESLTAVQLSALFFSFLTHTHTLQKKKLRGSNREKGTVLLQTSLSALSHSRAALDELSNLLCSSLPLNFFFEIFFPCFFSLPIFPARSLSNLLSSNCLCLFFLFFWHLCYRSTVALRSLQLNKSVCFVLKYYQVVTFPSFLFLALLFVSFTATFLFPSVLRLLPCYDYDSVGGH